MSWPRTSLVPPSPTWSHMPPPNSHKVQYGWLILLFIFKIFFLKFFLQYTSWPPSIASIVCYGFFVIAKKVTERSESIAFLNGSLTGDFRLQVFFMNQCPLVPSIFYWGRFTFCRKFAEIFVNQCLSQLSATVAISFSLVSMTAVLIRSRFCGLKDLRGLWFGCMSCLWMRLWCSGISRF